MRKRRPVAAIAALVLVGGLTHGLTGLLWGGAAAAVLGLLLLRLELSDLRPPRWDGGEEPAPDALERSFTTIRDELGWSAHAMREFERKLRPRLTGILAVQLVEHRGIQLDRDPDRARALAGAECWVLLDPARPVVLDWDAPGVDLATVGRVVDRLEAL